MKNNSVPQSFERQVLKQEFSPPAHIYWQSNLELFFSFCIALMEVLRIFTSHLCRETEGFKDTVDPLLLLSLLFFSQGHWHIKLNSPGI